MPTFNSRMSHLLKFIFIFCVIVAGAFYTGVRPPETLTIGPEGAEIALTSPFTSKSTSQSAGTPVQGKISRVVDGDTVHLEVGRETMKIRLDAIDTPEQDQAYGRQATSALKKKINRKQVLVYITDQDRYGRYIGRIILEGRDINFEMVAEGHGWHYKQYSSDRNLALAERKARDAGLGLWAKRDPVAPWDYRRR